jgi:cell division protein FtsL
VASLGPVVRTDAAERRGIGVGAFLLALVTAGALAHVGVRMKGIEVAYDLGREKRVNTQLEEERRRLNIEIGMLKDPGRVVAIARDKLKMGPPAPTDVVRLEPGQVLGATVPAPAEAPKRSDRAAARASANAKAARAKRETATASVTPPAAAPATDDAEPTPSAPAMPEAVAPAGTRANEGDAPAKGVPANEGDE